MIIITKLLNTNLVLLQKKYYYFFDQSLLFWMVYCLFHYKHISMCVVSWKKFFFQYCLCLRTIWNISYSCCHQNMNIRLSGISVLYLHIYIYINIFKICGPPKKKRFWVKCVVLMVLEYFFRLLLLLFIIVLEISL